MPAPILFWWCAASLAVSAVAQSQPGKTQRDGGASGPPPSIADAAQLTGREAIAVRSHVVPSRVYIGQQATYEVGVFLSDETRSRMRRNPEFVPPEMRSMLAYDLAAPATVPPRFADGTRYEVHVFRRALFPLAAGSLTIPPARLNYALPLSSSIFSREEMHTEHTQASVLLVLEPPASGRPSGFRGAVGQLGLESRVDSHRGRVGDPLLLTVAVVGVGNLALVPRPEVTVPWGDVVAGPDRIRLDTSGVVVRGRKEFDYLLTPRRAGSLSVPSVSYAYFDPHAEQYLAATSPPIDVVVAPGSALLASRQGADSAPLLPIRREFRGDIPKPMSSAGWYWLAIALTPVPALLLAARRRPRARRQETPAARVRAMAAQDRVDVTALRRDYALALSERIPGAAATLSNHLRLARSLRRAGVSLDAAADAARLLAELDAAVFAPTPVAAPDVARRADRALRAVDDEALPRDDVLRVPARATIATLALLGGALGIGHASEPTSEFNRGVAAYDARDFAHARSLFEAVALGRPRAADAWANAGSAAWQMGDTAAAAVGWHHAVRLDPLAEDVRTYLDYTPNFRGGVFGDVPPVPLSAVALAGIVLWVAGWWLVARGGRGVVRLRAGVSVILAALVLAVAGLSLSDTLHGRGAAIVTSAGRLHASPALTSEPGAEVLAGELAHVSGRQTAWTRLRLRDGRTGWIESRRLAFLEIRD